MKTIKNFINEKLHETNNTKYTCQPVDSIDLLEIIIDRIKNEGLDCDLNDIDTSEITEMNGLFNVKYNKIFKDFNGNISQWDVSNVKDMSNMFIGCENFNGDISMWDVSKVKDMSAMFHKCKKFNCDISRWNVSNVEDMTWMFNCAENFNQDLDSWNVSDSTCVDDAFWNCPTQPKWYKE